MPQEGQEPRAQQGASGAVRSSDTATASAGSENQGDAMHGILNRGLSGVASPGLKAPVWKALQRRRT